jgi:hypothetical protein
MNLVSQSIGSLNPRPAILRFYMHTYNEKGQYEVQNINKLFIRLVTQETYSRNVNDFFKNILKINRRTSFRFEATDEHKKTTTCKVDLHHVNR